MSAEEANSASRGTRRDAAPEGGSAVLYRFNATQARIEAAFAHADIATTVTDDTTFFERDGHGLPGKWIQMIRRAMATLVPQYSTRRMVKEYTEKYYLTK